MLSFARSCPSWKRRARVSQSSGVYVRFLFTKTQNASRQYIHSHLCLYLWRTKGRFILEIHSVIPVNHWLRHKSLNTHRHINDLLKPATFQYVPALFPFAHFPLRGEIFHFLGNNLTIMTPKIKTYKLWKNGLCEPAQVWCVYGLECLLYLLWICIYSPHSNNNSFQLESGIFFHFYRKFL